MSNPPKYVVDANIVIAWFRLPGESTSPSIQQLFLEMMREKVLLFSPDLLLLEVANYLGRKKLELGDETQAMQLVASSPLRLIPFSPSCMQEILALMKEYELTSYDTLYLYAAIQQHCQLLTDDKKLLKVVEHTINSQQLFF